jgi:hypothetical protein
MFASISLERGVQAAEVDLIVRKQCAPLTRGELELSLVVITPGSRLLDCQDV